MKKLLTKIILSISFIFLALLISTNFTNISRAEESEEIATPSAQQIRKDLQERIKNVNLNQAEAEVEEKIKEKLLLGYTGIIADIKGSVLSLENKDNLLQISLEEDTAIVKNGQEIELSSLAIDDQIIAIGYQADENILTGRRIVVTQKTVPETIRTPFFGQVIQITPKENTFILSTVDGEKEIIVPKKSDLDLDELEINQTMLTIIETNLEDETHTLLQFKAF